MVFYYSRIIFLTIGFLNFEVTSPTRNEPNNHAGAGKRTFATSAVIEKLSI